MAFSPKALVVLVGFEGLDAVVRSLRASGLSPIVAPTPEHGVRLLGGAVPDVAIIDGAALASGTLVGRLEEMDVPIVLVAGGAELARAAELNTVVAALPASPGPEEIAATAALAAGEAGPTTRPDVLESGPLRLDLVARRAEIEGRTVELPPKEFAILAELVLRAGRPAPSAELARRVWPESGASEEAVHRAVYRLRRLIAPRGRARPWIVNRRGFGYVLNLRGRPREPPKGRA